MRRQTIVPSLVHQSVCQWMRDKLRNIAIYKKLEHEKFSVRRRIAAILKGRLQNRVAT